MDAGRALDIRVGQLVGIKRVYYSGYDTEQQFPQYIPSGKPWRTHHIDAVPVPHYSTDVAAAWRARDAWCAANPDIAHRFYRCFGYVELHTLPAERAAYVICVGLLFAAGVDVGAGEVFNMDVS